MPSLVLIQFCPSLPSKEFGAIFIFRLDQKEPATDHKLAIGIGPDPTAFVVLGEQGAPFNIWHNVGRDLFAVQYDVRLTIRPAPILRASRLWRSQNNFFPSIGSNLLFPDKKREWE